HRHVAAGQRDLEAIRFQPCPARNVLCVAELRCGNFFSTKICGCFDRRISFHYQRRPGVGCTGYHSDFFTVRFEVRVKRRPWADVCHIERPSEDCLHCGRARIVSKPLNLDVWAKALFEPASALARKRVRNYALRVSDVWKMPESNR